MLVGMGQAFCSRCLNRVAVMLNTRLTETREIAWIGAFESVQASRPNSTIRKFFQSLVELPVDRETFL